MSSLLPKQLLFASLVLVASGALAQGNGESASLWAQASLYRDEWGVPHVYADNPRAMAFAFGYAQAEDHLEGMLMAYRVANGRAAEVLGESMAPSDEFALKMAHADLAQRAFTSLDPLSIDLCEGFALGANAWIVEHPDRTPSWGDGVRPEDPLALLHCYLMSFAPFDLPDTYHREASSTSGNAWALSSAKTETGETLLAINPHTYYDSPFRWYEAHLVCPEINIAGATLFGLPVILQGHNEVLGWALTPNQPDFADVYIESLMPQRRKPNEVTVSEGQSEEHLFQQMQIATARPYYVRTPHGAEQRSVSCMTSNHGPIVGKVNGRPCGYLVGGYQDFGGLAQLMEMARAKDLASFQSALDMQQLPCFHIVYADGAGNIFYLFNAKMGDKAVADKPPKPLEEPKEPEPGMPNLAPPNKSPEDKQREPVIIDWDKPVPGDKPLFMWRNIIPADTLPSLTNPESGYIQACGTPPWAVTDGATGNAGAYPGWFSHDRDTLRAQRVRRLLSMGKRSFRDCQAMLYDVVVPGGANAVQRLLQIADQRADFVSNAHPDLAAGLDVLRSWNGLADLSSTGMTIFHAWWSALRGTTPHLGGTDARTPYQTDEMLMAAVQENSAEFQDAAMDAAVEAVRIMRNEFEAVSVPWGNAHSVTRGTRETGLAGGSSGEPIFVSSDSVFDARKWRVTYGYGFAMVVSFGEKPTAVSMTPFGASEDPKSPHFTDQLDLMAERRFKVTRFAMEDVQRHASSARGRVLYLRPKGMAGLAVLTATVPIEARLNVMTESASTLPEDLVPFTLYMEIEKAPKASPVHVRLEIPVPAVLCARENLSSLSLCACDARRNWVRLPSQTIDLESRTFTADDDDGPGVYAVLGPSQFRAQRLAIPEDASDNTVSPESAPPAVEPVPQQPLDVGETPEADSGMRGVPPKHSRAAIAIPKEAEESKAEEPPKLNLNVPKKPVSEKNADKEIKGAKRNYRFQKPNVKKDVF